MDNYHVAWCSLSYCRCVQSLYWLCLNCDFTTEVVKSFGMYPQLLYFFFLFSLKHNALATNTTHYEIHKYFQGFLLWFKAFLCSLVYCFQLFSIQLYRKAVFVIASRLSYISPKLEITLKSICGLRNLRYFSL